MRNELVSYTDKEILHCMIKGMADEEIRAQVLGCTDEMALEATVKIIEIKEAGKKAGSDLDGAETHEALVSRVLGYKKAQQQELVSGQKAEGNQVAMQKCKYCGKRGHGAAPSFAKKNQVCPAFNKTCNVCSSDLKRDILRGVKPARGR